MKCVIALLACVVGVLEACSCGNMDLKTRFCNSKNVYLAEVVSGQKHPSGVDMHQWYVNEMERDPEADLFYYDMIYHDIQVKEVLRGETSPLPTRVLTPHHGAMCGAYLQPSRTYLIMTSPPVTSSTGANITTYSCSGTREVTDRKMAVIERAKCDDDMD